MDKRSLRLLLSTRKAQGGGVIMPSKMFFYMVLAVVVPLLALFLVTIVTSYKAHANTYLGDTEDIVLSYRFTSSADCFAYKDKATGRTYTGVIDTDKFTQERMDSCYDADPEFNKGCFRLDLKTISGKLKKSVESRNWDQCSTRMIESENIFVALKDGSPALMQIWSLKNED